MQLHLGDLEHSVTSCMEPLFYKYVWYWGKILGKYHQESQSKVLFDSIVHAQ